MQQSVLIVGAGVGGTAILKILLSTRNFTVRGMADHDSSASGLKLAKEVGIPVANDWRLFIDSDLDIIIEVTGNEAIFNQIRQKKAAKTILVPGSVAYIMARLLQEKEELIDKWKSETLQHELIFNSTEDGMIVINPNEAVILYNDSAERMSGIKRLKVIDNHIDQSFPSMGLVEVLKNGKMERNIKSRLMNGLNVIVTRIPIIDTNNNVIGALAVFKDITKFVNLAEEITNLKQIQNMLEAIIQSSDDAISVVDQNGKGILINPAYTRITGLTSEQVIGQPATADISEGESMHMQVLKTRKAVRGVRMRVGAAKREVIVNVAPILVNAELRGSVGVIHDMSEMQMLNQELKRARQIIRTLEAKYSFDDIIGCSEEMTEAIEQAKISAETPAIVLLRGESGTGKELFAHAIHNASSRKYNKFVRVNCAALSETLLESELFGYEEGSFSGAKRGGKHGLFEEADNGSIFLDEIGEMTPNTQAKLLRVLQENEILRVGGTKAIPINVRIIAATNVDLEKAISTGKFREDLYYRLNRLPIYIAPLRSRKEDIPLLCPYLLRKLNQEYGRNIEGISDEAIQLLMTYDWPGNVRELENILGRAIIFMKYTEKTINKQHIPDLLFSKNTLLESGHDLANPKINQRHLADQLSSFEKKVVAETLERCNGNKTQASRELGVSVRNLYYKLEKHNLI